MKERHLLIHLDDSETKQKLVAQAWMEAGGKRDDLLQTEDPQEALAMIHDLAAEILNVVTDEDIEGRGRWALKVVEAAIREHINRVLVYSGNVPANLPLGVEGISRTNDPQVDKAKIATWLNRAA